jgi:hypothetical protein
MKTIEQGVKGHGFVLVKHEISHFLQWSQNIPHNIMQSRSFPTMNAMKNMDPHRDQKLVTNAVRHPKD